MPGPAWMVMNTHAGQPLNLRIFDERWTRTEAQELIRGPPERSDHLPFAMAPISCLPLSAKLWKILKSWLGSDCCQQVLLYQNLIPVSDDELTLLNVSLKWPLGFSFWFALWSVTCVSEKDASFNRWNYITTRRCSSLFQSGFRSLLVAWHEWADFTISHHSHKCQQQQQRHIARLESLRPSIEVLAKSDKVPRHVTENPVFVVWSKSTVKQLVEWPL